MTDRNEISAPFPFEYRITSRGVCIDRGRPDPSR